MNVWLVNIKSLFIREEVSLLRMRSVDSNREFIRTRTIERFRKGSCLHVRSEERSASGSNLRISRIPEGVKRFIVFDHVSVLSSILKVKPLLVLVHLNFSFFLLATGISHVSEICGIMTY